MPSTPPPLAGLTHSEAALRLAQDGPNVLPGAMPKTLGVIVLGVITEPMFVMLLVAGGVFFLLILTNRDVERPAFRNVR